MAQILSHINDKSDTSTKSSAPSLSSGGGSGSGSNAKTAHIYSALQSQIKGRGAELVKQVHLLNSYCIVVAQFGLGERSIHL